MDYMADHLSFPRSLDSPSNSLEAVSGVKNSGSSLGDSSSFASFPSARSALQDSDLEAEPDPPDWTRNVDPAVIASLSDIEKKRQEVLNGRQKFFVELV